MLTLTYWSAPSPPPVCMRMLLTPTAGIVVVFISAHMASSNSTGASRGTAMLGIRTSMGCVPCTSASSSGPTTGSAGSTMSRSSMSLNTPCIAWPSK